MEGRRRGIADEPKKASERTGNLPFPCLHDHLFAVFDLLRGLDLSPETTSKQNESAQGVLVAGELEFEIDKFVAQSLKHQRDDVRNRKICITLNHSAVKPIFFVSFSGFRKRIICQSLDDRRPHKSTQLIHSNV